MRKPAGPGFDSQLVHWEGTGNATAEAEDTGVLPCHVPTEREREMFRKRYKGRRGVRRDPALTKAVAAEMQEDDEYTTSLVPVVAGFVREEEPTIRESTGEFDITIDLILSRSAIDIFHIMKGSLRYARPYQDAYRGTITQMEADRQIIRLALEDVEKGEEGV
jgi:hypothetical protein